jgi:hypothetical protein
MRHRKVLCATYVEASTELYCALLLIEGYPRAIELTNGRRNDLGAAVEERLFGEIGQDFDFHIVGLRMLDKPNPDEIIRHLMATTDEIAWFEGAAA